MYNIKLDIEAPLYQILINIFLCMPLIITSYHLRDTATPDPPTSGSVGAAAGGSGGHGQGTATATPQSIGLQTQTPSNVNRATNDGKKLRYS